mgnify:CR=1 FL=1
MGSVIDIKTREEVIDYSINNYEFDQFTVTWENLGLSYHGTLQIEYLLKCLENIAYDNES